MIYKDIEIQNFRGIKKLSVKNLGSVNLFVGKNNSGKTSLLESVFLTTGISNPQLAITIDLFRSLTHDEDNDFRFIFYDMNYNNSPFFEATLHNKETRTLSIKPTLKVSVEKPNEPHKPSSSTNIDNGQIADGLTYDFTTKSYHSQKNSYKATITFENVINRIASRITPAKNYKENLFGIFLNTGTSIYTDSASRLEKIIIEKKKDEVIGILQLIDKNIRDIIVGTKNMIYLDIGLESYIPSNIEGEGLNRLLALITTIYSNRNGVLIVDEIENGFHYKVFGTIWKAIIKSAKAFNVQLFISTHNIELLQQMKVALEDPEFDQTRNDVSIYTLVKKENKEMEAIQYNFVQFENAIQQEIEIR